MDHDEILRQLRAARDGRYRQNEKGRYVIDGEARPVRRVREKLLREQWVTWLFSRRSTVGLKLTTEGTEALKLMEVPGES